MSITTTPEFSLIPAADARSLPYGWGELKFLADAQSGTSPDISMALVTISGGKNMRHTHPNCDELLYLMKGHIRHLAGTKWLEMSPGDTIRIARGVVHQAEVVGQEEAVMLVVYSAGNRETVAIE